jgi:hypothetical protein
MSAGAVPRYKKPFRLTVPPAMDVQFTIKARSRSSAAIRYRAVGLPPGATLNATTGAFRWKATGRYGQQWPVVLWAESADGKRIQWPFRLRLASRKMTLAWSFGIGKVPRVAMGYEWKGGPLAPHCAVRSELGQWREKDLNGDGTPDILLQNQLSLVQGDGYSFFLLRLKQGARYVKMVLPRGLFRVSYSLEKVMRVKQGSLVHFSYSQSCVNWHRFLLIQGMRVLDLGRKSPRGKSCGSGVDMQLERRGGQVLLHEHTGKAVYTHRFTGRGFVQLPRR